MPAMTKTVAKSKPADKFPLIKTAQVADLIPYARNSRTHSSEQIGLIAASIKEFGFLNPVIVDGEKGIIAGHGRILAAKKLGMVEVPAVEASHLTDAQRKAYIIADNNLALNANWDEDFLRLEISALIDTGFDLSVIGFDDGEIEAILAEKELIKEKKENLNPITYTRILISIPTDYIPEGIDDFLKSIVSCGGEVDYGGN